MMPKLAQVWHLPKRETVDARDHALGVFGHSGCSQTAFSTMRELDTMKVKLMSLTFESSRWISRPLKALVCYLKPCG